MYVQNHQRQHIVDKKWKAFYGVVQQLSHVTADVTDRATYGLAWTGSSEVKISPRDDGRLWHLEEPFRMDHYVYLFIASD